VLAWPPDLAASSATYWTDFITGQIERANLDGSARPVLQAGEPIAYVKDQLGHSSIQVTVDVYGHFIPGANRAAVNRLTKAVADAKPRPGATQPQPEATIENEVIAEAIDKNGAPGVTPPTLTASSSRFAGACGPPRKTGAAADRLERAAPGGCRAPPSGVG
jgi:hypothetical protein